MRISDWSSDVCSSDLQVGRIMIGDRDLGRDVVERLVIGEALAVGEGRAPVFGDVEQRRCLGFVRVPRAAGDLELVDRSEERRVGKECVSTCRSRWSTYH